MESSSASKSNELHFELSPVQGAFILAGPPDEIFFLIGPQGEGKTFAGGAKVINAADRKLKRGKGMLRGALVRDTGTNISDHTIPSLREAFGKISEFKPHGLSRWTWRTPNHECIMFGLDSLKDLSRLQGPEWDYIWLEEPAPIIAGPSSGLREEVFNVGYSRLRGTDEQGSEQADYKWLQITMNPSSEEHWTYRNAVETPLPGTRVFHLPYGSNKHLSQASRRRVLTAYANRPDLAARYIGGKWGSIQEGVAVTPEYKEENHRASFDIEPLKIPMAYRVWDGWHNPVCGIWQRTPTGRLFCTDVLVGKNIGIQQLIETQVKPLLDLRYAHIREWEDFGDPTIETGDQSNPEQSAAKKINTLLGAWFRPSTNDWDIRRESMKTALNLNIDGEPMILISHHERHLHLALKGGWHYAKSPSGVVSELPVKDDHSHPGDMFSYLCAQLVGWRPPATQDKRINQLAKRRAKSYVNS